MEEDDIAWPMDANIPSKRSDLFHQPSHFAYRTPPPAEVDTSDPCFNPNAYLDGYRCAPESCAALGWPADCFGYVCAGGYYDGGLCEAGDLAMFTYRKHDKFQYLYETFPMVISPLVGVRNEHFAVWMRLAAFPRFRKL